MPPDDGIARDLTMAKETMKDNSALLDMPGEEKQHGNRGRKQIESGGVLTDFIVFLVSIAIIVTTALFLASMHTGGGL
jgi:hypothetical protein